MAVTVTNSDVMSALADRTRVRTTNFRGSLLSTIAQNKKGSGDGWEKGDTDSRLILFPIGVNSLLVYISYAFDFSAKPTALRFVFELLYKENNGEYVSVAASDEYFVGSTSKQIHSISFYDHLGMTLAQIAESTKPDLYKAHLRDKYMYLAIKVKTKESTNDIASTKVRVYYVDGSPSGSPVEKISVDYKKK